MVLNLYHYEIKLRRLCVQKDRNLRIFLPLCLRVGMFLQGAVPSSCPRIPCCQLQAASLPT